MKRVVFVFWGFLNERENDDGQKLCVAGTLGRVNVTTRDEALCYACSII